MQSHIRKVYACLAVTCHLHFWQNDRDLLRATDVTYVFTKLIIHHKDDHNYMFTMMGLDHEYVSNSPSNTGATMNMCIYQTHHP